MRGINLIMLFRSPKILVAVMTVLVGLGAIAFPSSGVANDLPLAAGSPMAGFSFDDRPLILPVQRNFQMAMLTASSQIGRSCGRMESYGWRMAQTEQKRVNLIFSNTVDRLRALGYTVEAQTPSSISKDITLFTADRGTKHFLFMWSAGEIGLVMVLCESSAPLTGRTASPYGMAATQLPPPQDVLQSKLETPTSVGKNRNGKVIPEAPFTPYGDWVGDYTCLRGYTGATLHINKFKGEDFEGVFHFYPTPKNPYVPKGSYAVYGQYDHQSQRILINPGNWLVHPAGYYKTIIIGSFDPMRRTFSGFFQGIMGCTSFEAKLDVKSHEIPVQTPKKAVKKKPVKKSASKPAPAPVFAPEDTAPVPGDIKLPDSSSKPAIPAVSTPPAPAEPALPPPPPLPVTPVPVTPPGAVGAPLSITPQDTAPVPNLPMPTPAPDSTPSPKPTSSIPPQHHAHAIILADDTGCGPPSVQQLQPALTLNNQAMQMQPAPVLSNTANQLPPATTLGDSSTEYMSSASTWPSASTVGDNTSLYSGNASTLNSANYYPSSTTNLPPAQENMPSTQTMQPAPCYSGANVNG